MQTKIFTAEVADTLGTYNGIVPAVTIKFRSTLGAESRTAFPLNPYSFTVPLKGEHVVVYQSIGPTTTGANRINPIYYYGDVIPARGELHANPIFGTADITIKDNQRTSKNYRSRSGIPNKKRNRTLKLGETFTPLEGINYTRYTQPIEGDYIIQGRYGQSIRLGSSVNTQGVGEYYVNTPGYTGIANSPIMILRTPPNNINEKGKVTSIEDPGKDSASIYLTSTQRLKSFVPAHNAIGDTIGIANWSQPQLAMASDRIVLNAKTNRVFIIGKTDVNIVTTNWAMQMNNLFNIIEKLIDVVTVLSSGSVNGLYSGTGPVASPTQFAELQILMTNLLQMKTKF